MLFHIRTVSRRPVTAKTRVCTHSCPEEFFVNKVSLDRVSLLGIRLLRVSCHRSNARRFIVVFHRCLEVNLGTLLEIRPKHIHSLYDQLVTYVYRRPVTVHYIHSLCCLP